jgi:hypothetical protein
VEKKDIAVEFGISPSSLSTIIKNQARLKKNTLLNDCNISRKKGKAVMYYFT